MNNLGIYRKSRPLIYAADLVGNALGSLAPSRCSMTYRMVYASLVASINTTKNTSCPRHNSSSRFHKEDFRSNSRMEAQRWAAQAWRATLSTWLMIVSSSSVSLLSTLMKSRLFHSNACATCCPKMNTGALRTVSPRALFDEKELRNQIVSNASTRSCYWKTSDFVEW